MAKNMAILKICKELSINGYFSSSREAEDDELSMNYEAQLEKLFCLQFLSAQQLV